jgi:hypothetical protein
LALPRGEITAEMIASGLAPKVSSCAACGKCAINQLCAWMTLMHQAVEPQPSAIVAIVSMCVRSDC